MPREPLATATVEIAPPDRSRRCLTIVRNLSTDRYTLTLRARRDGPLLDEWEDLTHAEYASILAGFYDETLDIPQPEPEVEEWPEGRL